MLSKLKFEINARKELMNAIYNCLDEVMGTILWTQHRKEMEEGIDTYLSYAYLAWSTSSDVGHLKLIADHIRHKIPDIYVRETTSEFIEKYVINHFQLYPVTEEQYDRVRECWNELFQICAPDHDLIEDLVQLNSAANGMLHNLYDIIYKILPKEIVDLENELNQANIKEQQKQIWYSIVYMLGSAIIGFLLGYFIK